MVIVVIELMKKDEHADGELHCRCHLLLSVEPGCGVHRPLQSVTEARGSIESRLLCQKTVLLSQSYNGFQDHLFRRGFLSVAGRPPSPPLYYLLTLTTTDMCITTGGAQ